GLEARDRGAAGGELGARVGRRGSGLSTGRRGVHIHTPYVYASRIRLSSALAVDAPRRPLLVSRRACPAQTAELGGAGDRRGGRWDASGNDLPGARGDALRLE